jgi:hypothetical protein
MFAIHFGRPPTVRRMPDVDCDFLARLADREIGNASLSFTRTSAELTEHISVIRITLIAGDFVAMRASDFVNAPAVADTPGCMVVPTAYF